MRRRLKRLYPNRGCITPGARPRLLRYARAIARGLPPGGREATVLLRWAANHAATLGLPLPAPLVAAWSAAEDEAAPSVAAWRKLCELLDTQPALTRAQRPFAALGEALGLDRTEEAILTFAADYGAVQAVEVLWDELASHRGGRSVLEANAGLIALFLHVTQVEVAARLRADAPLRAAGLLMMDEERQISILPRLLRLMGEPAPPGDLRAALLGAEAKAPLPYAAFGHLGAEAGRVRALLRGALAERAPGVHVLLYGPPGTGKTAFAAALAAECGVRLHEVGTQGQDGDELSRGERLSELRLAQRLLAGGDPALLLLDEAEDLFEIGRAHV